MPTPRQAGQEPLHFEEPSQALELPNFSSRCGDAQQPPSFAPKSRQEVQLSFSYGHKYGTIRFYQVVNDANRLLWSFLRGIRIVTILLIAGVVNWGVRVHFLSFFYTNLVNFAETFFLIRDKSIRWISLLTLAAFFMPRCSEIHSWVAVVIFHSNHASSTFRGSVSYARPMASGILRSSSAATPAKPTRPFGAPTPSARLLLAPQDDQISIINARPLRLLRGLSVKMCKRCTEHPVVF